MKKRLVFSLLAIMLLCAQGCSYIHSVMRADTIPVSDFLPEPERLIKQADTFPFHYVWVDPDIHEYTYVYIAPVNTSYLKESGTWAKFDRQLAGNLDQDISELADFMRQAYVEEFKKNEGEDSLIVTDNPDQKDCLVIELAITSIVPTKAELNAIGFAVDLAVPGIGILTGALSEGSVGIEGKVVDNETKKVVAMSADNETDEVAVFSIAKYSWLTSTRNNIRKHAEFSAQCFSANDYRTITRDFPIKLFAY